MSWSAPRSTRGPPTRVIAAVFPEADIAREVSERLVDDAVLPPDVAQSAELARYPDEEGRPSGGGGIVAARIEEQTAPALHTALLAHGGTILVDLPIAHG